MNMSASDRPSNLENPKNHKGFTLIELMAVVAIVSILVVLALPVYLDYVTRSKVSEGMVFAAEAKTSVSEYYYNTKKIPGNNAQAGLPDPNDYNVQKFIRKLEVTSIPSPVSITITFKLPGTNADNKLLQLIGETRDGYMNWTCLPAPAPNGIKRSQAPPNCRG